MIDCISVTFSFPYSLTISYMYHITPWFLLSLPWASPNKTSDNFYVPTEFDLCWLLESWLISLAWSRASLGYEFQRLHRCNDHVTSRRQQHFTAFLTTVQLSHPFHPIFCNVPWAFRGEDLHIDVSLGAEHSGSFFSALWQVTNFYIDYHPLQREALLTKVESSTNLWLQYWEGSETGVYLELWVTINLFLSCFCPGCFITVYVLFLLLFFFFSAVECYDQAEKKITRNGKGKFGRVCDFYMVIFWIKAKWDAAISAVSPHGFGAARWMCFILVLN